MVEFCSVYCALQTNQSNSPFVSSKDELFFANILFDDENSKAKKAEKTFEISIN